MENGSIASVLLACALLFSQQILYTLILVYLCGDKENNWWKFALMEISPLYQEGSSHVVLL
jgi:hypothetical protein